MHAIIGAKLLANSRAQPAAKPFEIYDARLPGFTLRVQPSGVRSFYARIGRNRRIALGKVGELLPDEARERCQKVLGNFAHGRHPLHGIDGTDGITLGMFIDGAYTSWVTASRPRTAANTLDKLYWHFRTWYPEPLTAITVERIEAWKARCLREGRNPATVLRDLFTLSSVLWRAVHEGELADNPVRRVDKPRIDRKGKVRFLDPAEESRLRTALLTRDEEIRTLRAAANERRMPPSSPVQRRTPQVGRQRESMTVRNGLKPYLYVRLWQVYSGTGDRQVLADRAQPDTLEVRTRVVMASRRDGRIWSQSCRLAIRRTSLRGCHATDS